MTSPPQTPPSATPIFVVSGPSGAGKTSLCARALADLPWIRASVSHTTRAPRAGEVQGKDYVFVDRPVFERMVRDGAFLEWAEVHGELYGTSRANRIPGDGSTSLLLEVDCSGARQIREQVPDAVLIFVMTPSFDDLISRIQRRGRMTPEELDRRIRTARNEIQQAGAFDYLVINDRFSEAAASLQAILTAQRCTRARTLSTWLGRWHEEMRRLDGPPR